MSQCSGREEHPVFISLCGSPPAGDQDRFQGSGEGRGERRTGIPAFGFRTNGMNTYLTGAGMAFEMLAGRVRTCKRQKAVPVSQSGRGDESGRGGKMQEQVRAYTKISHWDR